MKDWPRLMEPELRARLLLSDEGFFGHMRDLIGSFPPREATPEILDRGRRYPWHRPPASYLLRDGEATLLSDLEPGQVEDVVARHAGPGSGRSTLLAYGANGAPRPLTTKLAHHEDAADREVLVLAGELHELDVVASAAVTVFGAMPATLTASPGTAVRAAALRVTTRQLTTLAFGELTYRIGRLGGTAFSVDRDAPVVELGAPLAFVSRWGAFAPDGVPVPLAAVPARDRRWPAWEQSELLDRAAALVEGEDTGGEALVTALMADPAGFFGPVVQTLQATAQPFDYDGWTPMPAEALAD